MLQIFVAHPQDSAFPGVVSEAIDRHPGQIKTFLGDNKIFRANNLHNEAHIVVMMFRVIFARGNRVHVNIEQRIGKQSYGQP